MKLVQFVKEIVARICGASTVHSPSSAIRGQYSEGRREAFQRDWYQGTW